MSEYLVDILHLGSQALLVPVMLFMALLIATMLFILGTLVVEYFTSRRHFKVNAVRTITAIRDADYHDITAVIASSSLLEPQAAALLRVARNMGLPDEELFALAGVELERCDSANQRRVAFTDTASKCAPMLGLMATLIPLGPGIVALGGGDVQALSQSLLIAFDATVMGLASAILAVIISRVRRNWYSQYATMMKSLMSCVLEEAARAREEGLQLPYGVDEDAAAKLASLRATQVVDAL
jgi:biopolymer transport protein ExbB/TolQ